MVDVQQDVRHYFSNALASSDKKRFIIKRIDKLFGFYFDFVSSRVPYFDADKGKVERLCIDRDFGDDELIEYLNWSHKFRFDKFPILLTKNTGRYWDFPVHKAVNSQSTEQEISRIWNYIYGVATDKEATINRAEAVKVFRYTSALCARR